MSQAIRDAAQALLEAHERLVEQEYVGCGDLDERLALVEDMRAALAAPEKPIDMILHCPACLEQHIDEPDPPGHTHVAMDGTESRWGNPPHRSHLCKHCGFIWRPADVATNGVAAIKTKGKDDMVSFDGPAHELRMARLAKDLANPPKIDWEGDRP